MNRIEEQIRNYAEQRAKHEENAMAALLHRVLSENTLLQAADLCIVVKQIRDTSPDSIVLTTVYTFEPKAKYYPPTKDGEPV